MFVFPNLPSKQLSSQAERSQFSQLIHLLGMKLLVQYTRYIKLGQITPQHYKFNLESPIKSQMWEVSGKIPAWSMEAARLSPLKQKQQKSLRDTSSQLLCKRWYKPLIIPDWNNFPLINSIAWRTISVRLICKASFDCHLKRKLHTEKLTFLHWELQW